MGPLPPSLTMGEFGPLAFPVCEIGKRVPITAVGSTPTDLQIFPAGSDAQRCVGRSICRRRTLQLSRRGPARDLDWSQTLRITSAYLRKRGEAYSGSPAFRRPSINSFAFDCPPRAINADIVKAGSNSSTRAAASCASTSRLRWAKADARQR